MDFKIVEFVDSETVDWIPSTWIIGIDECQYPKLKSNAIAKMKLNLNDPEEDWPSYRIRILGSASSVEDARKRTKRAEWTSDLCDAPLKRPIQRPCFFVDSCDDTSRRRMKTSAQKCQTNDLPPFPIELYSTNVENDRPSSELEETTTSQGISAHELVSALRLNWNIVCPNMHAFYKGV